MKAIITGGQGFVGSHVVEHLLKNTDWDLILFDKLSYASIGKDRLMDMDTWEKYKHRVKIYNVDLNMPVTDGVDKEVGEIDYILHLAAESHVDNSISDPVPFILNNVRATLNILEYARKHPELKMFVNFSTDEVYGPAPDLDMNVLEINDKFPAISKIADDPFNEKYYYPIQKDGYPEFFYHNPSNPYSASKSAQEAIGIAYSNTYKVPVITTHTMNIIGERQHYEKFVPKIITHLITGEKLTIHGNADKTKSGTRFYLHARNLADALLHVVNQGYKGYDEWNIAGLEEVSNLELAQRIAEVMNTDLNYEIVDFHSSRPGHDLRYALDSSKLINSGYTYPKTFNESLEKTVEWILERQEDWLC